jgi:hypothetical protein
MSLASVENQPSTKTFPQILEPLVRGLRFMVLSKITDHTNHYLGELFIFDPGDDPTELNQASQKLTRSKNIAATLGATPAQIQSAMDLANKDDFSI